MSNECPRALKIFKTNSIYFIFQNVFGWTWSWLHHVGSSSLTRDPSWAPCIGNTESQPLDHWRCPLRVFIAVLYFLYSDTLTWSLSHLPFPLLGMLFSQTSIGLVTSLLQSLFFKNHFQGGISSSFNNLTPSSPIFPLFYWPLFMFHTFTPYCACMFGYLVMLDSLRPHGL